MARLAVPVPGVSTGPPFFHSTNGHVQGQKEGRRHSIQLSNPIVIKQQQQQQQKAKTWGRHELGRSWLRSFFAGTPVFLAPLACLIFYIALAHFNGSVAEVAQAAADEGLYNVFVNYTPRYSSKAAGVLAAWIGLQFVLYFILPGEVRTGQRTPAGHLLSYRMNGLNAWIVSHIILVGLCLGGYLDPGFIPRNWSGLVFAWNVAGISVTAAAFMKAYLFPTHPEDRKFSGCSLYDFYMGIELNPRIGKNFDFKLFTNGRVGMMIWTVIDFSNIAYQYQETGSIGAPIVLVTLLHAFYTIDFFINEHWYLETIDIAHDHYGFYLSWGCFAFLPVTYTLQTQYLALYPTSPSTLYLSTVTAIGLAGYWMFRAVNDQKLRARRSDGKCMIWGKPAEVIRATYKTADGATHKSLLLVSGWWGWSRHANYVGDLLLSWAACALVGTTKVIVWWYIVYMTILLVHRCLRDEARGKVKYGATWDEYCKRVPYRLVPGIW
ncbi:ERG4/ERG24 ergosterol biosynthesis protein [Xylariaceae sp. FL0255]|nr:ERG4/ERG24 ergosterol biosynthesis protein [Xylariaceae sp. FL0255]